MHYVLVECETAYLAFNPLKDKTNMFHLCSNPTRTYEHICIEMCRSHLLRLTKAKTLYKISGIKFSNLELKLSGCTVQPPPMKRLILN